MKEKIKKMNYLKSRITARFVVFLTVVMIIFWSIPCNIAFGETQEGSELQDLPGSEQSETTDMTTEVTAETTEESTDETTEETATESAAEKATEETAETATDATDAEATLLPDTTPPVITIIG